MNVEVVVKKYKERCINVLMFFTLLQRFVFLRFTSNTTTTTSYTHYLYIYIINALPMRILTSSLYTPQNTPQTRIRIFYIENEKGIFYKKGGENIW